MSGKKTDEESDREMLMLMRLSLILMAIQVILGLLQVLR